MDTCQKGLKWESRWIPETKIWESLGDEHYQNFIDQIHRRNKNPNMNKISERGEETQMHRVLKKLYQGIGAEYAGYYIFNQFLPGYYKPPRDDGASWKPDLYSIGKETLEMKCTVGDLDVDWRKKVEKLSFSNKMRYYSNNSSCRRNSYIIQ